MTSRLIFRIVAALAVIGIIAAIAVLPLFPVTATSQAERTFVVEVPMERARKILVRTNAIKKIASMDNGELIDQQWQEFDLAANRPLRDKDWNVSGTGQLTVLVRNSYLGDQTLKLSQNVDITNQRLESINQLVEPAESIKQYDSRLLLEPNEAGTAEFLQELSMTITTKAGLLTRSIVIDEIQKTANRTLENQEAALREVIDAHANKWLILPDFGGDE